MRPLQSGVTAFTVDQPVRNRNSKVSAEDRRPLDAWRGTSFVVIGP
jgi:hypothetical protein